VIVTATFMLADWVVQGLANGTFERVGGMIREVGSKQVVTWLREVGSVVPQTAPGIANSVTSMLNLLVSGVNTGVSVKGFDDINQRLGGIENQLGALGKSLQLTQGMLQFSTATSVISLGVSVMGFAVIAQRLNELEKRVQKAEVLLNKINRKIDLSFYANFRVALDLAMNAFTMSNPKNRRSSALQAINRFIEAEYIYTELARVEIEHKSLIVDKYLLTLTLAYLAEVRCYLELGEYETAMKRFEVGSEVLRSHIQNYVQLLLTSNPAAYLQPQFKGQIDLRRLTKVYQWINPSWNENAVFEAQRENLVKLAQDPNKWVESLPSAIWDAKIDWAIKAFWDDPKPIIYKRLPQALELIESMIETNQRFEAYKDEVQVISELKISFQEWLQIAPSEEPRPEGANLMFIIPFNDKSDKWVSEIKPNWVMK
jgi:tetratricopeptide (TPR) repeat protein